MKKVKRNIIIAAVLLFVCAAVYLNWSYNNSWGAADPAMVKAEDEKMTSLGGETDAEPASDYFAQARLTRQTSRDEALSLLETAASSESASQETIDSAMNAIAAMANWSMARAPARCAPPCAPTSSAAPTSRPSAPAASARVRTA